MLCDINPSLVVVATRECECVKAEVVCGVGEVCLPGHTGDSAAEPQCVLPCTNPAWAPPNTGGAPGPAPAPNTNNLEADPLRQHLVGEVTWRCARDHYHLATKVRTMGWTWCINKECSWFQSDTVTATCTGPDWSPEAPQCTRVSCSPLQQKLDQSVEFTASILRF